MQGAPLKEFEITIIVYIYIHQSLLLDKKFPSMTTRASSDIIDQIKAEQSRDEPCSTHGIFAYGRGAGRQALCRGVGTKWLGMGQLARSLPNITSGPEVRQIFKFRTVPKPDIFLPGRRTFNTFKNRKKKSKLFLFVCLFGLGGHSMLE